MISIIIPTFNEEKLLPRLLGSIRKQTDKDFEVIVADNDSLDKTKLIAESFGVKVVKGGMPAVGRNNGVKIAKGEWLLFLDADVVLPPNFLEKTMEEIKKHNFEVATCMVKPLSNKNIDKFMHLLANRYMLVTQKFFPHAPGSCIFIKKEKHVLISGFDEKIKLGEDQNYVSRASRIAKFGVLKSVNVPISVRRLEKEGRFNLMIKFLMSELHIAFLGPIYSDFFNYKFGYSNKELK